MVAVVAVHPWPRHGADRVEHLVDWPACIDVVTERAPTGAGAWPHAREQARIDCENLGPWVGYARFASTADLRTDLLHTPPRSAVCIAGTEVVVNGLEAHQFPKLCRKLHGDRVDGVVGLPDHGGGVTIDEINRSIARERRRDAQAEGRALRAYFSRTTD